MRPTTDTTDDDTSGSDDVATAADQSWRAYDELADLYDAWCAGVTEDVPFYVGLADALANEVDRPLRIVELGAGSGRITLPLAAAGHHVVAIDLADSQLRRLATRAADAGVAELVTVHRADLRKLAALVPESSTDLVVAPFRALLHATGDRDHVLAAARIVLRPGGAVAFDVFHPPPASGGAQIDHTEWQHRRSSRTHGGRWRFEERAVFEELGVDGSGAPTTRVALDVRCTFTPGRGMSRRRAAPGAPPPPTAGAATQRVVSMTLETVPPHAWLRSLEHAGFVLDGAYGWFDARPLEPGDEDSIWVGRAPA